jgi:hypothetical protein
MPRASSLFREEGQWTARIGHDVEAADPCGKNAVGGGERLKTAQPWRTVLDDGMMEDVDNVQREGLSCTPCSLGTTRS